MTAGELCGNQVVVVSPGEMPPGLSRGTSAGRLAPSGPPGCAGCGNELLLLSIIQGFRPRPQPCPSEPLPKRDRRRSRKSVIPARRALGRHVKASWVAIALAGVGALLSAAFSHNPLAMPAR